MHSVEIAPNIYWVGYVDWNVRDFHGYKTHAGTTYNAYLVIDEKIALIDTVKAGHEEALLRNIRERIDPAAIDYIVSNHTEPDHSSSVVSMLKHAPRAQIVASPRGEKGLRHYYPGDWNCQIVKSGDTISLGKLTLSFIETPMLHWPDSMFTYVPQERLLFSMDAFGQHLASSERLDRHNDLEVVMAEAKTYYANILMHLGSVTSRTLKQADELAIQMIAPSHGVIWTEHIPEIIKAYQQWSSYTPARKALVIYDTMWGSTELMANAMVEAFGQEAIPVKLLRLTNNDLTLLATEMLDAAAVAVGSPTLNNTMLPTVAAFLTYMKGLKPKNTLGMAFGSFGWRGGAVDEAANLMKEAGMEMAVDSVSCAYRPDATTYQRCRERVAELAGHIRDITTE